MTTSRQLTSDQIETVRQAVHALDWIGCAWLFVPRSPMLGWPHWQISGLIVVVSDQASDLDDERLMDRTESLRESLGVALQAVIYVHVCRHSDVDKLPEGALLAPAVQWLKGDPDQWSEWIGGT